jgi:hypothetical protein
LYEVFCKEARDEFKDDTTIVWENARGEEAIAVEENGDIDREVDAVSEVPA